MQHWILQCNPEKWRIFDFYADGQTLESWSVAHHIDALRPGDDVALWLTGADGGVAAVGEVTGVPEQPDGPEVDDSYYADPPAAATRRWALPIRLTRTFLADPVSRDELRADPAFAASAILRRPWASNPFPVSDTQWRVIVRRSAGRGTSSGNYLPAEALTSATALLRRLVGQPLQTITGRTNTVLAVTPPIVLVATGRSPAGQPVLIEHVDEALRRLVRDGSVEIHPRSSAYRSAFVGAVLLTLPGARHTGSPPVISLVQPEPGDDTTGAVTFGRDLSRTMTVEQRAEQDLLRHRLFGSRTDAPCALCGDTYPVRFLWTAHIKKRAACTDDEKRDLDNIAMPACLFGCDALFEAGYIAVNDVGRIDTTGAEAGTSADLIQRLQRLRGRRVSRHRPATAAYFAWHHTNTFSP